jgi:hypothetical protein
MMSTENTNKIWLGDGLRAPRLVFDRRANRGYIKYGCKLLMILHHLVTRQAAELTCRLDLRLAGDGYEGHDRKFT